MHKNCSLESHLYGFRFALVILTAIGAVAIGWSWWSAGILNEQVRSFASVVAIILAFMWVISVASARGLRRFHGICYADHTAPRADPPRPPSRSP